LFNSTGSYTVYAWAMDTANNISTNYLTQSVSVSSATTSSLYSETFATNATAGTQFDSTYTGWTYAGGATLAASSNNLVYTRSGGYGLVSHLANNSTNEYCATWRFDNATVSGFFGFTMDVETGDTTGFQAFMEESSTRTTWRAGRGTLVYTLTGWTFTTTNGWPASWSTNVVHQLSLQALTQGGTYTRVYLWIDGQQVGYWQDGTTLFAANRRFGLTGESSGRTFRSVEVTEANNVPAYDASSL
jgi:hypothetical protein